MSTYRLLTDHYVGTNLYQAGSTQSTADVGGLFPTGWLPTPDVDPLDTAAVNAFYAQGPARTDLVRSIIATINVGPPVTYWKSNNAATPLWSLTGLGVAKAPIGF